MDDSFRLWFTLFLLPFLSSFMVSGQKWDGLMITQSDYQALLAFKHQIIDPRGALTSWNNQTHFNPCSGWAGIKCVNGRVIAIQLPWKGLSGQIPENIGLLTALRRVSLHDNLLSGPLPQSLGSLPNLRAIYLFNNRFSGSIPPSIANSLLLQTLDLSNNQLTGFIPPGLDNSTRLYRLNLSFNGLSGSIPMTLTPCESLAFLALQNNNLSGRIPSSLGKLTMLQELNLSHNKLEGNITDGLGGLFRLVYIDISNNAINGSFPETFSNLSSLVTLNLENNNLDSPIPESISHLQNLSVLNLSGNKFRGRIPASIGNITRITFLDLSRNNFIGEIPVSLDKVSNLSSFTVSYNNLSGPVPSVLAKKFNSSSFVGNIQLCGYSGSNPCPSPGLDNISPSSSQTGVNNHGRKLRTRDIILIAAGALLIILLILCCVLLCFLIRKRAASKASKGKTGTSASTKPAMVMGAEAADLGPDNGGKLVHFDSDFIFTADSLLCATAETMAKSAYGTTYKATLEDSDNTVAVKRLREKITKPQKEFESEVSSIGKIRHPNILALRAYYVGPKGEKLLVYDYMPNGSLASFLHARGPETSIPLATRKAIAMGIARGLSFLHTEQNIVHGNLTSSNVLLDHDNTPKIAEVGLSHLMTVTALSANPIATAGNTGYRAPELSKPKNASAMTDVFSLGVILLELLTGKSPGETGDEPDLPQWAASAMKDENNSRVFDMELSRDADGDELLGALRLAFNCVDPSPTVRPSAWQVLQGLEGLRPEEVAKGPEDDDATVV